MFWIYYLLFEWYRDWGSSVAGAGLGIQNDSNMLFWNSKQFNYVINNQIYFGMFNLS
jgi:hypothetical protein